MQYYKVSKQYNDSYAFRENGFVPRTEAERLHQGFVPDMSGNTHEGVRRCETCGELLAKWNEPLSGLVVKQRSYDIASTYDGVTVVSKRFKSLCEMHEISGLQFRQLPNDPDFFAIHSTNVVEFDTKRRKTRYENQCQACGRYESVVGATPVFLKPGNTIGELEFARTDVEFGSEDGKHPLLLCGEGAARLLQGAKLNGLELVPVDNITS